MLLCKKGGLLGRQSYGLLCKKQGLLFSWWGIDVVLTIVRAGDLEQRKVSLPFLSELLVEQNVML